MALTERQRAIVAAILDHDDPLPDWREPWDIDRSGDLVYGGHPLKVTGDRWEWRIANRLRFKASNLRFERPTWLTAEEIEAHGTRPDPWARPVDVEIQGRVTRTYNVAEIRGLPERLYRPFWEIHPVNPEPPDPGFERSVRSLAVEIHHRVDRLTGRTVAEYRDIPNRIIMPPYELFFSARDYCRSLAHELIHWAAANTNLVKTILESEADDYARHELVSEFGTAFLLAELGIAATPHPQTVTYVRRWLERRPLTTAEITHAVEDATRVAAWLCHEAPTWQVSKGEVHRQSPPSIQNPRHTPVPQYSRPDTSAIKVADAHTLKRTISRKDRDAWDHEAVRLLEGARAIDLQNPAVTAAIEAAVALETPADTPPLSATAWLKAFRESTTRTRAMRAMTKSAPDMSTNVSRGPRFT